MPELLPQWAFSKYFSIFEGLHNWIWLLAFGLNGGGGVFDTVWDCGVVATSVVTFFLLSFFHVLLPDGCALVTDVLPHVPHFAGVWGGVVLILVAELFLFTFLLLLTWLTSGTSESSESSTTFLPRLYRLYSCCFWSWTFLHLLSWWTFLSGSSFLQSLQRANDHGWFWPC